MSRLGNRVNRVYPRGQPGGYAPSLNLAGWLPRGCTDVFCTQNPKKPVTRPYPGNIGCSKRTRVVPRGDLPG